MADVLGAQIIIQSNKRLS